MEQPEAVEVAQRRAELETEVGDLDRRKATGSGVEDVLEGGTRQRFEREHGMRPLDQLVGPNDMRVRQAQEHGSLPS